MADLVLTIAGQLVTLRLNGDGSAWDGELAPGLKVTLFKPYLPGPDPQENDGYALFLWGEWGQLPGAHGITPEAAAEALTGKLGLLRPLYRAWEGRADA